MGTRVMVPRPLSPPHQIWLRTSGLLGTQLQAAPLIAPVSACRLTFLQLGSAPVLSCLLALEEILSS